MNLQKSIAKKRYAEFLHQWRAAHDKLSRIERLKVEIMILTECEWTANTLANKKTGRTPLRRPEVEMIKKIYKEVYNINLNSHEITFRT